MASLLGTSSLPGLTNVTESVYKFAFRDSALWLQNALSAVNGFTASLNISIPVPLLGFTYENPVNLELLKYSYSSHPYLNKAQITNSYIKEQTSITIRANRAITNVNSIPIAISTNLLLTAALEKYCDAGGLFTLVTPYQIITNLALVSLKGVEVEPKNQPFGIGYEFELIKINVTSSAVTSLSDAISKLTSGITG